MSDDSYAREKAAVLRRAMIRVKPDYFSLSAEAQEHYRVNIPKEDWFYIQRSVLNGLFHIQVNTPEQLSAALDSFDDAQYLLFNSVLLPVMGIGEDSFFLNEPLGSNTALIDFNTLHDYDFDDHGFQEQARKEAQPSYVEKPYRGCLNQTWARLNIDGAFHYAILSMQANYVCSLIDEQGFVKIQELIPYDYVDGKDHGKREGDGMVYDKQVAAGGREAELEELQDRFYGYVRERHEALLNNCDDRAQRKVYLIDRSQEYDPCIHFVFSDKSALQAVRFQHFMQDCRSIVGDHRELDVLVEQECRAALHFLEQSHQDILENFDPTVVKFRRKRKIILADGVLDDLL